MHCWPGNQQAAAGGSFPSGAGYTRVTPSDKSTQGCIPSPSPHQHALRLVQTQPSPRASSRCSFDAHAAPCLAEPSNQLIPPLPYSTGPDTWELELDLSQDHLPGRLLTEAAGAFPNLIGIRISNAYIGGRRVRAEDSCFFAGKPAWGAACLTCSFLRITSLAGC